MFIGKLPLTTRRKLRDFFLAGSIARGAARVVGVKRMTGILSFRKLREKIAAERIAEAQKNRAKSDIVEVDECYTSGGKRRAQGCAAGTAYGQACVRRSHRAAR